MNLPFNFQVFDQVDAEGNATPEWMQARAGIVTASAAKKWFPGVLLRDFNGRKAGEPTADRMNYCIELALEELTGSLSDNYVSQPMIDGRNREPIARALYEIETGTSVQTVGFCLHRHIDRCGASPDGVVSPTKLLEIKCPKRSTHFDYWLKGEVPKEYILQMQWQMCCAGEEFQECDFVSYHPDFPEDMQLFIVTLEADPKLQGEMEQAAEKLLAEVKELLQQTADRRNGDTQTESLLRRSISKVQSIKQQIADEVIP